MNSVNSVNTKNMQRQRILHGDGGKPSRNQRVLRKIMITNYRNIIQMFIIPFLHRLLICLFLPDYFGLKIEYTHFASAFPQTISPWKDFHRFFTAFCSKFIQFSSLKSKNWWGRVKRWRWIKDFYELFSS